ncbi:hypothetical protein ACVFZR_07210 [Lacticaseibacillus paracasei]
MQRKILKVEKLVNGVHDATVQAVIYEYPVTRDDIRELEFLPAAKDDDGRFHL